jgi:hypothetical protein
MNHEGYGHYRPPFVPAELTRLPVDRAFATVILPLHLNWSDPEREFDLSDRAQRVRVYEIVLREGGSKDFLTYIDGALLADIWDDLVLPRHVRAAWDRERKRLF